MSEQQELLLKVPRDHARMSAKEKKLRRDIAHFEKFTPPTFMEKLARAINAEAKSHKSVSLSEATVKHLVRVHFDLMLDNNVAAWLTRKLRKLDNELGHLLRCRRCWLDDLPELP